MLDIAIKAIHESESRPASPSIITELSMWLKDDKGSFADYERILRRDPGIAANLIHLSNTAYFGVGREIATIRQAIAFLGTDRLIEMAASAWLCTVLPYRIPGYDISAKSMWLHSIATGVLSEQLSEALQLKLPNMAFTAGLLHDIGKLVVGDMLAVTSDFVLHEIYAKEISFVHAEQALLSTDHTEVGSLLCELWKLPAYLSWIARWHHSPNTALTETENRIDITLLDVVHLADGLAHSLGFGADMGVIYRTVEDQSMERLLLNKHAIDQVVSETIVNAIWEIGDLVSGGISC